MLLLSLLISLVSASAAAENQAGTSGKPACCLTNSPGPGPFSDTSLYQLESTWISATGSKLKLQDLKGKVQVATMFFAKCEFACPVLVHDMKRIEAALPATLRTNVGFLLVSFDSERDTPEALRAYSQRVELDPERWTLLRGSQDDVLELAALLGIQFKKDSRGQFAHSNVITILNSTGEIVFQQIGLNQDIQPTLKAITTAAGKPGRP